MSFTGGPSVAEVCDALEKASARYALLLDQVKDPSRPAIGSWNVGDTVMHNAASPSYFLSVARGESEPMGLDDDHSTYYESELKWDPPDLINRFQAGEAALLEYARSLDGDREVEFFKGLKAPTSTLLAIELSEVLVHGFDIAKASGLAWQIPADEAALALSGTFLLWPYLIDPETAAGFQARYDIRIRNGARVICEIEDGRLKLEDPSRDPVDCCISSDPVAFLLMGFNRIQPWVPLLQGKMGAWGRRFWLAGKLPGLLKPF